MGALDDLVRATGLSVPDERRTEHVVAQMLDRLMEKHAEQLQRIETQLEASRQATAKLQAVVWVLTEMLAERFELAPDVLRKSIDAALLGIRAPAASRKAASQAKPSAPAGAPTAAHPAAPANGSTPPAHLPTLDDASAPADGSASDAPPPASTSAEAPEPAEETSTSLSASTNAHAPTDANGHAPTAPRPRPASGAPTEACEGCGSQVPPERLVFDDDRWLCEMCRFRARV